MRHNSHIFEPEALTPEKMFKLRFKSSRPRNCVLVQGLEGSGKTTLLNALVKQHLFPYFTSSPVKPQFVCDAAASTPPKPSVAWLNMGIKVADVCDFEMSSDHSNNFVTLYPFAEHSRSGGSTMKRSVSWYEVCHSNCSGLPSDLTIVKPVHVTVQMKQWSQQQQQPTTTKPLTIRPNDVVRALEQLHAEHWNGIEAHFAVASALLEDSLSNIVAPLSLIESQRLADRPAMHHVHSVLYVVDADDLQQCHPNRVTLLESNIRAATTCDGRRCQCFIIINRKNGVAIEAATGRHFMSTSTVKKLDDEMVVGNDFDLIDENGIETESLEEEQLRSSLSRHWRTSPTNIFILDVRAAAAAAILSKIAPMSTTTVGPAVEVKELLRLRSALLKNHIQVHHNTSNRAAAAVHSSSFVDVGQEDDYNNSEDTTKEGSFCDEFQSAQSFDHITDLVQLALQHQDSSFPNTNRVLSQQRAVEDCLWLTPVTSPANSCEEIDGQAPTQYGTPIPAAVNPNELSSEAQKENDAGINVVQELITVNNTAAALCPDEITLPSSEQTLLQHDDKDETKQPADPSSDLVVPTEMVRRLESPVVSVSCVSYIPQIFREHYIRQGLQLAMHVLRQLDPDSPVAKKKDEDETPPLLHKSGDASCGSRHGTDTPKKNLSVVAHDTKCTSSTTHSSLLPPPASSSALPFILPPANNYIPLCISDEQSALEHLQRRSQADEDREMDLVRRIIERDEAALDLSQGNSQRAVEECVRRSESMQQQTQQQPVAYLPKCMLIDQML